jgi:catechol 2,3-dioxygenase
MLAFAKSDSPGLTIELGHREHRRGRLGMQQMAIAARHGWGVGRRVISSNYFRYVRDIGQLRQYSYDIDFIPADVEWSAGD